MKFQNKYSNLTEEEKEKIRIKNRKKFFQKNKENKFLDSMVRKAKKNREYRERIKFCENSGSDRYKRRKKIEHSYNKISDRKEKQLNELKPEIKKYCRARYSNKYILEKLKGRFSCHVQTLSAYIFKCGFRSIYGRAIKVGNMKKAAKITPILLHLADNIPDNKVVTALSKTPYSNKNTKDAAKKIEHCKRMRKDVEYFCKERAAEMWEVSDFPELQKYLKEIKNEKS